MRIAGFVASLAIAAVAGEVSAVPAISIDALPPYGAPPGSLLSGSTSGIDPAQHHVADYIGIEGFGWCTKPSFAQPTVGIAPDGTFAVNVVTGGIDDRAILYCSALLPLAVAAPTTCGGGRIPSGLTPLAITCRQRFGATLEFSGYRWGIKESPAPVGPGGNRFSFDSGDVFVDAQDRLHLNVAFDDGQWWSTEVIAAGPVDGPDAPLGYGAYEFTTESDLDDLHPSVTFGAFLWDPHGDQQGAQKNENREIDFEATRWGQPADPTNAQSVVQPYDDPATNLARFTIPSGAIRWSILWQPDRIRFRAFQPGVGMIHSRDYTGPSIPDAGRAAFRFNLWLNQLAAPSAAEAVIGEFTHLPEPAIACQLATLLCAIAALGRSRRVLR